MFTYAVDVMGGDLGPRVAFKACRKFLRFRRDVSLIIAITPELEPEARSFFPDRHPAVRLLVCDSVIHMNDKPSQMLRKGLGSTMAGALREYHAGRAQGMISAGNTGALMVLARHILGTLPGIDRPALATTLPTRSKPLLMLDLGANLEVDNQQLVQFAALGAGWCMTLGNLTPKVGLLNVGRESAKGTGCIRQAAETLQATMPDLYAGFCEGDDLYRGELDVLVTNGFAGNIALKVSEGLSDWLQELFYREFRNHWFMRWFAWLWLPAVRHIEQRISPARHGGALLLGLKGVVVKTHGKSDARTFRYALRYLHQKAQHFDAEKLTEYLEKFQQMPPERSNM